MDPRIQLYTKNKNVNKALHKAYKSQKKIQNNYKYILMAILRIKSKMFYNQNEKNYKKNENISEIKRNIVY